MKIKSLLITSSVLMISAAFANTPVSPGVGTQEINITNNLIVSEQPTSVTVMPDGILSKHEYHHQNGDVTCTLNGGGENICNNIGNLLQNGVSIPYGQTLQITIYPWGPVENGQQSPGNLEWQYVYTIASHDAECGVESNAYVSNPDGSLNPADISATVDADTFLGGSSYCKGGTTTH